MTRSLAALSIMYITAAPALADVGHMLERGHGHVHWDELAILAGIAAAAIGYGAARLCRRAGKARADG